MFLDSKPCCTLSLQSGDVPFMGLPVIPRRHTGSFDCYGCGVLADSKLGLRCILVVFDRSPDPVTQVRGQPNHDAANSMKSNRNRDYDAYSVSSFAFVALSVLAGLPKCLFNARKFVPAFLSFLTQTLAMGSLLASILSQT